MSDKKVIPPYAVIKMLELALVKKQGQIATTLDDLDTLQDSHRQASEHLDKLQADVMQIEQSIRLLQ